MWFGAVSADCAVFLGVRSSFFAFLSWQQSCFLNFDNMKTVNVLLGHPPDEPLPGGWPRLSRV